MLSEVSLPSSEMLPQRTWIEHCSTFRRLLATHRHYESITANLKHGGSILATDKDLFRGNDCHYWLKYVLSQEVRDTEIEFEGCFEAALWLADAKSGLLSPQASVYFFSCIDQGHWELPSHYPSRSLV